MEYNYIIAPISIYLYVGNNKCGAGHNISTIICCSEGFESTPGWDPVTGLGVIDFPKFLSTLATVKGVPVSAPTPNSSSDSSGLSGGAIAGIVIAVLAFLVGVVIAFLVVRRKSSISEPLIIESRENSKFGA